MSLAIFEGECKNYKKSDTLLNAYRKLLGQ